MGSYLFFYFCTGPRYSKSAAQIMIKWSLQRDFICIPKTSKRERIAENFDVFDFEISDEDMEILVGS